MVHRGSITDSTNGAGQIGPAYRYDSYGNVFVGISSPGLAFTGREWDAQAGLFFYRARYYAPHAGRYVSEDPTGLDGGLHLYTYVGNKPTLLVDPFGLRDLTWMLASRHQPDEVDEIQFWLDFAGGAQDMFQNYLYMRNYSNVRGQDAYFHCLANCEATRRGPGGEFAAACISDVRERVQLFFGSDKPHESANDRRANLRGRRG